MKTTLIILALATLSASNAISQSPLPPPSNPPPAVPSQTDLRKNVSGLVPHHKISVEEAAPQFDLIGGG